MQFFSYIYINIISNPPNPMRNPKYPMRGVNCFLINFDSSAISYSYQFYMVKIVC